MNGMSMIKHVILRHAEKVERAMPDLPMALDSAKVDDIILTAEQAVAGVINFAWNGQTPVKVGRKDIDWSGTHIRHQEWPAQLNRFYYLVPLSQAYRSTGDERYAEAARDYITDWIRAHPTKPDWAMAAYDNTLNLCIRVGHLSRMGWMGTLPVFLGSPHFGDSLVQAMLESMEVQLAYEMRHMPNVMNWRIAAADGLVAAGLKLEFLPGARAWRDFGVKVLNDAWHRQVMPDGCHAERNPSYHTWMTRVMTGYCNLGRALPELGLVMEPARVAMMWEYALESTRPNGEFNGLHDCNGERTGAWSASRPAAAIAREREAFLRAWNLPVTDPPLARYLPQAGQVLLRTGWTQDDAAVTFDASIWGYSHCHLSRNSIQLHAFRQTMLVDPGTITYEGSDPMSAHAKSTSAHNTCTLNQYNQSETNPQNVAAFHGNGYNLVQSVYEGGYWEGDYRWGFSHMAKGIWASHHRWMLWVQDLGLVIMDSMQRPSGELVREREMPPSLECNWQLAENARLSLALDGSGAEVDYGNCGLTMLFAHRPPGTETRVFTGSRSPLRGWLPTVGGVVPAPQIVQQVPRMERLHEEFLSVMIPWGAGGPVCPVTTAVRKSEGDRYGQLTLAWADGRRDDVYWSFRLTMMQEANPDFDTDASLVHIRKDASGRVVKACAADGTFLAPFVKESRPDPGVIVWEPDVR